MIQDIAPHKFKNHYDPNKVPAEQSYVLNFSGEHGEEILVHSPENGGYSLPNVQDLSKAEYNEHSDRIHNDDTDVAARIRNKLIYLFSVDDQDYFLLPDGVLSHPDFIRKSLRELRTSLHDTKLNHFIEVTAFQLNRWYQDNRFCGTCGNKTELDQTERAIRCPHCGRIIYPRIAPAVIVGVINRDRICLTKYAHGFDQYALVAGFTEIGETFEETVIREVKEEIGVNVKNIRYYKSQPWAISDNILAGYFCEVDGDPTIHMDENELKSAAWYRPEEIVLQSDDYSLTNEMMSLFKSGSFKIPESSTTDSPS